MDNPPIRALQDFLFGQYATDERTLEIMRAARRGIHHANQTVPQKPRPDAPVTLYITVGPELVAEHLYVVYSTEGDPAASSPDDVTHGTLVEATLTRVNWDTLVWGYLHYFEVTLPPFPEGTRVSYIVFAWSSAEQRAYFADSADRYTSATRFAYHVDDARPPAWAHDAIFYQVFLDRFHPGPGKTFPPGLGRSDVWGGTLAGLRAALPYLDELGVTALWLSPCYPSDSHHGYNVTDYQAVNPRLGTMEEMKALIAEIHERGMRIILDFVPNHTASEHPLFQHAISDPASPYRDWFYFREWPHLYEAFFDLPSLPKINTDHPDARAYLLESARFWLEEMGVDGFRMDHAHGTSTSFWSDYWAIIKRIAPDALTFGEVTETARFLHQYQGRLDGVLDFLWLQEARRFFIFDSINAPTFEHFLKGHELFFPEHDFLLPTFLDNHDMNRILWSAAGDKRRLKLAALCQFTQAAPPIIYYGTEVGVTQERDVQQGGWAILEESRTPMQWGDEQDRDLLAFYRDLIHFRRAHPATYRGRRVPLLVTSEGVLAYARQHEGQSVITVLNNSDEPRTLRVPLHALDAPPTHLTRFTGEPQPAPDAALTLTLGPREGTLLVG